MSNFTSIEDKAGDFEMRANHKLVSAEVVTQNTVSYEDDFITTAAPFIAPLLLFPAVFLYCHGKVARFPGQETSMMTVACVADWTCR